MSIPRPRELALAGVMAIVLAACSGAASPTPAPASAAPSAAAPSVAASPSPAASPSVAASSSPAASPSPAAATIAVPAGQLIFSGKLVICSDIPYPPQEFFDSSGNATGSDIDIGTEIAKRLGLTAQVQNSVFDTIIAALTGGKCDIIISAQNITTDRVKQVDMIPYYQAGQSFVVATGNPKNIKVQDDLCGKSIGAETGTTEVDYLNGTGDYKGQGLSAACTSKGKAAITVKSPLWTLLGVCDNRPSTSATRQGRGDEGWRWRRPSGRSAQTTRPRRSWHGDGRSAPAADAGAVRGAARPTRPFMAHARTLSASVSHASAAGSTAIRSQPARGST